MTKPTLVGARPVAAAPAVAAHTASLLDRIANAVGCEPSTFFKRSIQQEQTDEMLVMWRQLSDTKDREAVLAFMRERARRGSV